MDRIGELRSLVERWARDEGRTAGPVPGVIFYRCSKGDTCVKGTVTGVTLAVVVQGHKRVRVKQLELDNAAGQQLVVTGDTSFHSTTYTDERGGPFLSVTLLFPPEMIVKGLMALAGAGAPPTAEPVPAFVSDLDPGVAEALVRLLRALEDPVERRLLAPLIVEECALRLLRSDAAATFRDAVGKHGDLAKIDQAMRFMQERRSGALTVADVARHVGMSASHFAHRFREVARTSPMRYLRQARLEQARTLMLSEGARPSEAAARVGFESTSHFTREFKRTFGAPPADYARRFRLESRRIGSTAT